ncbi:MAG: hypothetical protein GF334_06440 [Candidatus Altiarchaeales archaeon]|nr:hypothetical protein [Candidatus Altiarchaeales archaeon]
MKDLDFSNYSVVGSSMDKMISDETDYEKLASEEDLPWKSGTRVAFINSVEALFTYEDCPNPDAQGTVITVRTASGDRTANDGQVFVLWDDGKFRGVFQQHLKPLFGQKQANTVRMRVKTSMDLDGFLRCGSDLVHKATKDLWALKQEGDEFVIERLFQDTGEPLKV